MPRDTSCSVSERIALDAPRILNEPVFCRFSHLKKSPAPAMAFRDADVRTGVRWILGAMRACASRMASHVGGWYWMDSVDEAVFIILVGRASCRERVEISGGAGIVVEKAGA